MPRPTPRPSTGIVQLTQHHLGRLAELERVVGPRYQGWGWDEHGRMFVDVLDEDDVVIRHPGDTLHAAIGAALRAERKVA